MKEYLEKSTVTKSAHGKKTNYFSNRIGKFV